jgi:hypothetical protein
MPDEPSLELPSLFKRKRRTPSPGPVVDKKEKHGPALAALPAALLTGAVVGLLGSGLVWLALRGCSSVRGTSSCGNPGFLLVLAIFVVMVVAGRALLGLLRVPDAGSTAFLAVALVAVLCLLFVDRLDSTLGVAVMVAVGVLAFGLAQWVTSTFTEPGERPR